MVMGVVLEEEGAVLVSREDVILLYLFSRHLLLPESGIALEFTFSYSSSLFSFLSRKQKYAVVSGCVEGGSSCLRKYKRA